MTDQTVPSTQLIFEKILLSIAERRLRPGVQLKEEQLAAIFNVSRARIRQALTAPARGGLVTIVRRQNIWHYWLFELAKCWPFF